MSEQQAIDALVVLSSVKWNFSWQRHHSLARAAAGTGTAVVFVEPHPRDIRQIFSRLRGGGSPSPNQRIPPGVRVLPWSPVDLLPGVTARRVRRALGRTPALRTMVLQYVPSRRLLRLARRLSPELHVYDHVLDWGGVPTDWYPPRGWARVEAELELDAALSTDSPVMQALWAERGLDSLTILPAADDEFTGRDWEAPRPEDPVGYFGTVQERIIDLELLVELARTRSIEMVGEIDPASREVLERAGIRLRSAVPVSELPPIIDRWSAIVLPYRSNDRTRTLVPAKIWNSLATGRPVITSGLALPEEIARRTIRLDVGRGSGTIDATRIADLIDAGPETPVEADGIPTWEDAWRDLVAFASRAQRPE